MNIIKACKVTNKNQSVLVASDTIDLVDLIYASRYGILLAWFLFRNRSLIGRLLGHSVNLITHIFSSGLLLQKPIEKGG